MKLFDTDYNPFKDEEFIRIVKDQERSVDGANATYLVSRLVKGGVVIESFDDFKVCYMLLKEVLKDVG